MTVSTKTSDSVGNDAPPAIALNDSPEDDGDVAAFAARIMARKRGIIVPPSAITVAMGAFRDLVSRLCAFPLGAVVGFIVGSSSAPLMFFVPVSWSKKFLYFLAAPLAGLLFGAALGLRLLKKGKLDALPLIAGALHRFCPVVTFPKALTHHVHGLVLVTRHADVRQVLERDDVFRVDLYNERMSGTTGAFFLGKDAGAAYDREQALGAAALGRDAASLRACVARFSQALIERALERSPRTIDVVSELAHPVHMAVLDQYYGIPDTRDERLLVWLQTASFVVFNFWIGGPYRAAAIDAGGDLVSHLRSALRLRLDKLALGEHARDDVLGRMLRAMQVGSLDPANPKNEETAVRTLAGLISGATVATIGVFVGAIDKLLDLPSAERKLLQNAAITGDNATVKRYLLEAARFSAYPPTLYRHAATPYVFSPGSDHEATVERGAWVVTMPILANFDSQVIADPEKFDPRREYGPNAAPLLFGWARHRCLGEHFAELLMVEMAKPLLAKGIRRIAGDGGRVQQGSPGVIPDGDYARRLVVRFD